MVSKKITHSILVILLMPGMALVGCGDSGSGIDDKEVYIKK